MPAQRPAAEHDIRVSAARTHLPVALLRWAPYLIALIAVPVFWYIAHAAAQRVPLQHVDGAYQTIAMLRHLDAGELPGRDFQPYLGIGIPMLLWPLYQLGGGHLVASQAAAIFAGLLATFAGGALLSWLVLRASGIARTGVLAAGGGLALLLTALPGSAHVHSLVLPGASLYSLRSALSYLIAASLYLAARGGRWHPAVSGVTAAFALTWSNDYALTGVLLLHVLLMLHVAEVVSWRAALRGAATSLAIALAGYALLGSLLTGGHLPTLLHYNFASVATDQHWYFAPYDRIEHFLTPGDLVRFWQRSDSGLSFALLAHAALGGLLLLPSLRRERATMAVAAACLTAFGAGLGSELGGHKALNYHQLTLHLLPMFALAVLAPALLGPLPPALERLASAISAHRRSGRRVLEVSALALLSIAGTAAMLTAAQHRNALANDPELHFERRFGGYLQRTVAAEQAGLSAEFGSQRVVVVSTYLNPWDLLLDHRQHAPTDSIIHALGELRPQFTAALDDARVQRVVTTNARSPFSIDARWENWSLHQNWTFYRRLLTSFTPAFSGTRLVLWTRSAGQALQLRPVSCRVESTLRKVRLEVEGQRAGQLYELDIRYRHHCTDNFTNARARAGKRREPPRPSRRHLQPDPRRRRAGTARTTRRRRLAAAVHHPARSLHAAVAQLSGKPYRWRRERCTCSIGPARPATLKHSWHALVRIPRIPHGNLM